MNKDIEEYGLFTYEEFSLYFDINEYTFNVYNGKYLKVAFAKGMLDEEKINNYIERYGQYTF